MKENIVRRGQDWKGLSTREDLEQLPTQLPLFLILPHGWMNFYAYIKNPCRWCLLCETSLKPLQREHTPSSPERIISCLALLSSMFQLEIKYSFFKKTFPNSDRIRTFLLCGHILPLFNLHGSYNYLSNTIFPARLGVPPGLCLFCSPLIPVSGEVLELHSVLSKWFFLHKKV